MRALLTTALNDVEAVVVVEDKEGFELTEVKKMKGKGMRRADCHCHCKSGTGSQAKSVRPIKGQRISSARDFFP